MDDDTIEIAKRAPAAAQYPSWFRKNVTPAVLYTFISMLLGGTVTCTLFYSDSKAAREHLAALQLQRDEDHKLLEDTHENLSVLKNDMGYIRKDIGDLKEWHAEATGIVKGSSITKAEKK